MIFDLNIPDSVLDSSSDIIRFLFPRIIREIEEGKGRLDAVQSSFNVKTSSSDITIVPKIGKMKTYKFVDKDRANNGNLVMDLIKTLGWRT
jgi:hypothetical protein